MNGTVMVAGPPGSGVTAVVAALRSRLTNRQVVEWIGPRDNPVSAVVFVASAAAHLTPSQVGLLDRVLAATGPVGVVGAVSKIDLHRTWADVLAANRALLPIRWVGVAAEPEIGSPRLDDLVDAVRDVRPLENRRRVTRAELITRKGELAQTRLRLSGEIHSACAQLRAELHRQAGELSGTALTGFPETSLRRVAETITDWDRVMATEFDAVMARCGLEGVALPAEPPPAVPTRRPDRQSPAEARLTLLVGSVFGIGAALTVSRLIPGSAPRSAAVLAAAIGLGLAAWLIRTRRLLTARASLQRWVAEVLSATRLALDQQAASRALAAEVSIGVSGASGVSVPSGVSGSSGVSGARRTHPPVPCRPPCGTGDTAD